jgi:hypothetical protein
MQMFFTFEEMIRMGLLGILTIITLIVDIRAYRKKRKAWNLIPSAFAIIVIVITIYKEVQRDYISRMDNLMIVSNWRGFQYDDKGFTYCFKKGTWFTFSEYRNSMGTMYYGKYSITGDRIQIISSNYRGKTYTLPKEGIIRDSMIYWNNSDSMKIVPYQEVYPVR